MTAPGGVIDLLRYYEEMTKRSLHSIHEQIFMVKLGKKRVADFREELNVPS